MSDEPKRGRGRPRKEPFDNLSTRVGKTYKRKLDKFAKDQKWSIRTALEHILDHFFGKPS